MSTAIDYKGILSDVDYKFFITANKLAETYRKNIAFINKRIKIQNEPNYDPYAKSKGQWSERQYCALDILEQEEKLNTSIEKINEILVKYDLPIDI